MPIFQLTASQKKLIFIGSCVSILWLIFFQNRKQHTDIQSNINVISRIKSSDLPVAMDALKSTIDFNEYCDKNKRLIVTDLGAADGQFVLDAFIKTGAFFLIHACELEEDRVVKYKQRITDSSNQLVAGKVVVESMETYDVPPSNIVFASHSLYYTASLWGRQTEPGVKHFFDKLFGSIEKNGVLQITMQSEDRHLAHNHLDNLIFEREILYPILNRYKRNSSVVTSAEQFEKALTQYKTIRCLNMLIRVDVSIIDIDIDAINFDCDVSGCYGQSSEGADLIRTYSRGKFESFEKYDQDQFMQALKERSVYTEDGKHYVRHINKVYTVKLIDKIDTEQLNFRI